MRSAGGAADAREGGVAQRRGVAGRRPVRLRPASGDWRTRVTDDPKPRRSSFEDLSDIDLHARSAAVATGRRTAILITAAVVLFAGAVFALLFVVLVVQFSTASAAGATVAVLIVY